MMGKAIDVVKRRGQRPTEPFDHDKLRRSIRAALLSVRTPEGEADNTTDHVAHAVVLWLDNKPVVTSHDLRRITGAHLDRFHPDAAYFYQHHRYII